MKSLMTCAAVLAVLAAPVSAETRYDRTLEQAVMDIVAKKMGELRGGFSYDAKPQFVMVQDQMATGSIGIDTAGLSMPAAPDELMPAVERRVSRIIAF
jgi:hypothetical protein